MILAAEAMTASQTKDFYLFLAAMCLLIVFLIYANEHNDTNRRT